MNTESTTQLYLSGINGNETALNRFFDAATPKLRRIAADLLRQERRAHDLHPTELVNDAVVKILGTLPRIQSHVHFFALARCIMDRLLMDRGRVRGGRERLEALYFSTHFPSTARCHPELTLSFDRLLDKLREVDPVAAETFLFREQEQMTLDEVARLQNRKISKVRRDHDWAREWLRRRLRSAHRSPTAS